MRQEIVMAYNLEREIWNQLGTAYPLGKYHTHHEKTQWFTLKTDIYDRDGVVCGELELTWFVEWRV